MDTAELTRRAHRADAAVDRGRRSLVAAVREAHASGMSQRDIARAVGRSQPEVSRLLRFHGTTPLARSVRAARPDIQRILSQAGLSNPRVFGSVARGEEGPDSDVDLLVSSTRPLGLLALARVERELTAAVGRDVDLVLDDSLRPDAASAILAAAVPL